MEVSREQFEDYKRVQKSGVTNMFNLKKVQELSGLDEGIIKEIMDKYGELEEKYSEN